MAYLAPTVTKPEDDEEEKRQQQLLTGATAAPDAVSGGASAATATAADVPETDYSKRNEFLDQNRGGAYKMAREMSDKLRGMSQDEIRSAMGEARGQFDQQVQGQTVDYDMDLVNQIINDPTNITPEQRQQFAQMRDTQYRGPGSLREAGLRTGLEDRATQIRERFKGLTGGEAGMAEMMRMLPQYQGLSQGQMDMERMLLMKDPASQQAFSGLRDDVMRSVEEQIQAEIQAAMEQAQGVRSGMEEGRAGLLSQLQGALSGVRGEAGEQYQTARGDADNIYRHIMTALGNAGNQAGTPMDESRREDMGYRASRGGMTDEMLRMLGVDRDQYGEMRQGIQELGEGYGGETVNIANPWAQHRQNVQNQWNDIWNNRYGSFNAMRAGEQYRNQLQRNQQTAGTSFIPNIYNLYYNRNSFGNAASGGRIGQENIWVDPNTGNVSFGGQSGGANQNPWTMNPSYQQDTYTADVDASGYARQTGSQADQWNTMDQDTFARGLALANLMGGGYTDQLFNQQQAGNVGGFDPDQIDFNMGGAMNQINQYRQQYQNMLRMQKQIEQQAVQQRYNRSQQQIQSAQQRASQQKAQANIMAASRQRFNSWSD